MADNAEDIKTASEGIKRASGDQGSAEVHSIQDQIAADRYNESKKRTRKSNPFAGLIYRQRPPGASGS